MKKEKGKISAIMREQARQGIVEKAGGAPDYLTRPGRPVFPKRRT